MIVMRSLRLARAGQDLFAGASLQIHPGWKVGVAGANGCGKSSLFALLLGELHAEEGELGMPPGWQIAHVAQEVPPKGRCALDCVLDGDRELREVETELACAETSGDGLRLAHAHERFERIGGYAAQARASTILHGLGFADADFQRPAGEFSGGWRMRLNLARALMARSDLLLLDEPTNHLDLDAIVWLEDWLRDYPGTLLLVSHDREFLDRTVNRILHFEQCKLTLYAGGYDDFERTRAARLACDAQMAARQQREVEHLTRFIERFRAKATKARQAQSRVKALARMQPIVAGHADTPFSFRFATPGTAPDPLLDIERAATGYEGHSVLQDIMLQIRPGSRIGLLGRNGAGKTTLVRLIAGELPLHAGTRLEGRGLSVGYFAQHQVERLRPDESALQHLQRIAPTTREQDLRDYLGGFDFRGERATTPCGVFSGGEKSRLGLALIAWTKPNLLLLDEPTNHLDLEVREALTLALAEYEGAVVLVSHDRHLLRTTVDELWLVAGGRAQPYSGDLDDYRDWLKQPAAGAAVDATLAREARRDNRAREAAERQALLAQRRPLVKEAARLEQRMAELTQEKDALEQGLQNPASFAGQREALANALKRQAEVAEELTDTEERWLAVQEQLESLAQP
ncbi:MAG: ATP-binding cassette domain-containing protein [Rhodocyclaceae bacterium]|nr:ATP-binding cassette domain-containing protein [Rhodocyclaceae bacterium]MBX3669972.1 ATP-binding cassette domain-containing protein [Rhodocyclaceae bacterium]